MEFRHQTLGAMIQQALVLPRYLFPEIHHRLFLFVGRREKARRSPTRQAGHELVGYCGGGRISRRGTTCQLYQRPRAKGSVSPAAVFVRVLASDVRL